MWMKEKNSVEKWSNESEMLSKETMKVLWPSRFVLCMSAGSHLENFLVEHYKIVQQAEVSVLGPLDGLKD